MKIKKIEDRIEPNGQFDVELQDCQHDCTVFYGKFLSDWRRIVAQGYKGDGEDSPEDIAEIKRTFEVYCFRKLTAKDSMYL